ncbi:ileal sodium/bile acid cotransporter-like [Anneissia japonica]|uniref:ileal sodium/bile acid cotransporter-like n=1 Tax=Anneissia japonica TaxID=1529436 RepID=UPI00142579DA|nr:ileal sodium/bile acid cotransporter-like [Anneissia japonica]
MMQSTILFLKYLLVCFIISKTLALNITITKSVNADDESDQSFYVTEDEVEILEVRIEDITEDLTLVAISTDENIFQIQNKTSRFPVSIEFDTVRIGILGVFVGIENIEISLESDSEVIVKTLQPIKVKRKNVLIATIYQWTLTAWLVISYITMGCKMDWRIIKEKLRKPYGVLIGAFCQFIIMPALSFGLAKLLKLDDSAAIGLVTVGSCPGGWLSNVFSLLLDVDFVLSLTMTFCSTILALGFMPLNLYLYATHFVGDNEDLKTPFVDIMIQLISLVIPVVIGMFILYKLPKVAELCLKCLKPCAVILIIISLGLGIPAQFYIFYSSWEIWVAAGCLPFVGCFLGFAISKIAKMELKSSVTISLETGVQNSLLAIAMVGISYKKPESDLIGRVPLLIALLTLMEGSLVTSFKVLIQKFCWKSIPVEDEKEIIGKDRSKDTDMKEINGNKTTSVPSISVAVQVGDENFTNGSTTVNALDNPAYLAE